jgi:hypothetical protein
MLWRIVTLYLVLSVTACAAAQSLNPTLARSMVAASWQADQHMIWEIDWAAAPMGEPVVAETWRAGERYRYEILESVAPALVGEVLVSNGQQVWRYNRFAIPPPDSSSGATNSLAPLTEAFTLIDHLLVKPPQSAAIEATQLDSGPAQKISLTFANGDSLTLWRDEKTGLPAQVVFLIRGQPATLKARSLEPLDNPPPELFGVVR